MADDQNARAADQTQMVTIGQNVVVAVNGLINATNSTANGTLNVLDTTLTNNNNSLIGAIGTLTAAINAKFPNWVTPPANSTAAGVSGYVAYSGSAVVTAFLYVCLVSGSTGSATWGRTQLTTSF